MALKKSIKPSRKVSRKTSKKSSRKVSRKVSRKTSKKSSRKVSKKVSRKSRKVSRKTSKKSSRKVSRKSSRKTLNTFEFRFYIKRHKRSNPKIIENNIDLNDKSLAVSVKDAFTIGFGERFNLRSFNIDNDDNYEYGYDEKNKPCVIMKGMSSHSIDNMKKHILSNASECLSDGFSHVEFFDNDLDDWVYKISRLDIKLL